MKPKLLAFILFCFTLCSFAYWQVPLCSTCHKPKTACICKVSPTPPPPAICKQCGSASCRTKDKHKVCPTCGQYDFKCRYNFNHPCSQCGKVDCNIKNKHEKCPTCGEYDFKCSFHFNHPCSQCGKVVCITKNMHEKCPTCGEYDFDCSFKFNHPCSQCGKRNCETKDKHEKCSICGEYDVNCRFKGRHPEFVDLGLSVKWATCNVGATCPEEYGDYFAWGETEPKNIYSWSNYKWSSNGSQYGIIKYTCADNQREGIWYNKKTFVGDNKIILDLNDDVAHVNWGGKWRMPTKAEQDELRNNCTWTWTSLNGVKGYKVTSKSNGRSIFLPAAGYWYGNNLNGAGSRGYYWSCWLTSYSSSASGLYFYSDKIDYGGSNRYCGRSVRAVCR